MTQELDIDYQYLIKENLLKVKQYDELKVLKFTNKAFFKARWDENLVEFRGLVLDNENNIVTYPFTKIFNLNEKGVNKQKTLVGRDREVMAVEKINGFLCNVSTFKGELLYSTTGAIDSEHAKLGQQVIEKYVDKDVLFQVLNDHDQTFMFEIVDESDPHIVPEQPGAYLIGGRLNELYSKLMSEIQLDEIADKIKAKRPNHFYYERFSDLLEFSKKDKVTEGYVVKDYYTEETLCKLKNRHYLIKKFLMRGKPNTIWGGFFDEDIQDVVEWVKDNYTKEQWEGLKEQERRKVLENDFFKLEPSDANN